MAYPSSVELLVLARRKGGQSKLRKKLLPGEDELPDPKEPKPEVGLGGPVLDFGKDGGVKLERHSNRWEWRWLSEERRGRSSLLVSTVHVARWELIKQM